MNKIKQLKYLLAFLGLGAIISCEEVIEIDLNSSDPVLVAEAILEPNEPVCLKLSYTADYFSTDNTKYLESSTSYLSDGNGIIDTLYYDGEGTYRGQKILGDSDNTYTLYFSDGNNGYQASSQLLPPVEIQNIWFEESTIKRPGEDNDTYTIHVNFSNITEQVNYYLLQFYINGEIEDDTYSFAQSDHYPDEEYLDYNPLRIEFDEGDDVTVIVYTVDEESYTYYNQLNDLTGSSMGGSSTPYNPQSNFGEKIMGFFTARSYDTTNATVDSNFIK